MAPPVEGLTECLYDTLGVERTVDPDKLKIAYRKMAMKWHPDKIQQSGAGASPDAYQKATERFQQINRAYEVLSDPVERTWYDSHRERILSASSSSANAAPGEFDLNLWPYFSPSAFSGFGETGNGFYAVYSAIFKKIHMQEQVFGRMYGNGDVADAPELGGRETPYQNVYSFYRYWQGFSSVKDFAWCDKYDTLQAPNRKVRRLMEEENNKVRKRERKEFNNSVRQLASFVKKRDKRVIEKQLELQKEQRQKEIDRKARQLALEKEKQEQIRLYKEQAWTVPDEEEEWETEDESEDDGTVKMEKTAEDLECVICGKRFKSAKQLQNHERSKKHLENLAALKGAFRNDDEQVERLGKQLGIDISIQKKSKQKKHAQVASDDPAASDEPDDGDDRQVREEESEDGAREPTSNEPEVSEEEDDDDNMLASMLKFQRRHASASNDDETVDSDSRPNDEGDEEEDEEDDEEVSFVAAMSNLQVNKQANSDAQGNKQLSSDAQENKQASSDAQENKQASSDVDEEAGVNDDSVEEEEPEKVKKGKSRRRAKQDRKQAAVSTRFSASASEQVEATSGDAAEATSDTGGPPSTAAPPPLVKHSKVAHRGKKIKKEKKGAKQDSHTCQTCGEDFDSRSQLFKHIAATNHAILKSK